MLRKKKTDIIYLYILSIFLIITQSTNGLLFNLKEDLPIKLSTDPCILDVREGMALSSCHSRGSLASALRWLAESSEPWVYRRKVMLSLMKGLWGEQTVTPPMCQGPQWRHRKSWLISVGESLFPLYAFPNFIKAYAAIQVFKPLLSAQVNL